MPTFQVPLFGPVYRNVKGIELTDDSYELMDGYLDEKGYSNNRPGLLEVLDLAQPDGYGVDGLFWWAQKRFVIAVCNDKIFRVERVGGDLVATDYTTNGPGTFSRPTFTVGVDSNIVTPTYYGLMAGGANITQASGISAELSAFVLAPDADAPTTVSHLDFIDGYVLAAIGKGFFRYAELNAPASWEAASFATAMRNPDDILALKVFLRQIFLFGNVTTEIWENDGVSPFAPTPGGFLQTGIIAPHSVTVSDDAIYWLDNTRHFVSYSSGPNRISTPYDSEIQGFDTVADCFGMRVEITGKPFIVFQFPAEQRTLVYNVAQQNWSEWGSWNSSEGRYLHWLGNSHCYVPDWGMHLVGGRDGKIHHMSMDYNSDNGDPIRVKRVTGHLDYGTLAKKRSRELRMRVHRGEGATINDAPLLAIRWRDDNGPWTNQKFVSLGKVGDNRSPIVLYPHGVYRTRQYELIVSDAVPVTFGGAEEDVDILR